RDAALPSLGAPSLGGRTGRPAWTAGQSITTRSARGQYEIVPRQTCAPWVARRVKWSFPARLAIRRCTWNEPLGPVVRFVPLADVLPLCLSFQCQTWPDLLLSISPSTSIRPLSGFALSFQCALPEQPPLVRTSLPPCEAVAGATSPTGRVSAPTAMAARAVRVTM